MLGDDFEYQYCDETRCRGRSGGKKSAEPTELNWSLEHVPSKGFIRASLAIVAQAPLVAAARG